jgi:tRNA pseudouridine38-40 synthase
MPAEKSVGIFRFAAAVEYHGAAYCGWQRQDNSGKPSVQSEVEKAFSYVADQPVKVQCAGRTDAGVHAFRQVVHFDVSCERPTKAWVLGANTRLPGDIRVHWARQVSHEFHARFSALSRTYRYFILPSVVRPAIGGGILTWTAGPLDVEAMHNSAQCLVGEHDFSSFRGASCQSRTPFRFVENISVVGSAGLVVMEVRANAFLHHMVRNIAGVLMEVGKAEQPEEWVHAVLQAKDRTCAAMTAPPNGLYLTRVQYPDSFGLPEESESLGILPGGMFETLLANQLW